MISLPQAAAHASRPVSAKPTGGDVTSRYALAAMLAAKCWPDTAGLSVLDVEFSSGSGPVYLATKLGSSVLALHPDIAVVNAARSAHAHARVTYRNARDLSGITGRSFDLVTCFLALERHAEPGAVMRQLAAALKPGGLLVVAVVNEAELPLERNASTFKGHLRHFTEAQLAGLASQAGNLRTVATFGQRCFKADSNGQVLGNDPQANQLPQPGLRNGQFLVHVFQATTSASSKAVDRNPATYVAESAIVHGGGSGIEHPICMAPRSEVYEGGEVGRYTYLNPGSVVYPNTSVGRFCSIGRDVHIGAHNHPVNFLSTHPFQYTGVHFGSDAEYQKVKHVAFNGSSRRTVVGHDVWIGTHAMILQGVTVGHGAIIGAGAIVTKDVPPYAIVAGNPARLIRHRFDEGTIQRLLESKWWEREIADLRELPFNDVNECLDALGC